MFFVLSKIFWFVANPLSLMFLLLIAGLFAVALRWRRIALASLGLCAAIFVIACWTTLGALLLHPLEDRFERPAPPPDDVTGIVVLGGGLEGGVNLVRGGYELNRGGDRFVEAAVLARRYPDAKVVISGGVGSLILEGATDAETAPRLLEALGVSRDRLILEGKSRNTYENALFSRERADPGPGETWLLVTSAFHMPRSVGLFRKVGFDVVAWPADYRTAGNEPFGLARDNALDSLGNLSVAVREWVGLFAYYLTGRTTELLPAPQV
ncbi:YdcF family protein [Mesorhizobium xinjiangense]|uniref:YdcF family protein n=1 Tax=Mesorhizobium xinjiangense TaxID=2678685 RepID=UPI0012EE6ABD|nr:YdcF family protein [Mesorhizobium xinjiangense]